ncbi:uncharacterized protein I206_106151 [Kwoniella pini CBS 10737]|uniref:25S rRNA (uridine-N(3))-methyltransferase BMT5-like domain-containing protein n=1 Tax=Kwoniella pini CBS 10737 TaxID=1296096 RepID=A0A1B9I177_9TREE|nr:uncharacterized protein I206_04976 [Kwoniella pini CBS 10737]OCF49287.1 hypothetical protein I206_04976 [Kwoniella pini CBS 10737]
MAKLKAALANQQYNAAKAAAKKRSLQNEENKKQSIKANLTGSKKGSKKQKIKTSLSLQNQSEHNDKEGGENSKKLSSSSSSSNLNKKSIIPFDKTDSILLIGEGNFSFTLSLLNFPHNLNGKQIFSTCFDNKEICFKKYPDSEEIIKDLIKKGVKVEFGIDATCLEKFKVLGKGKKFSKVIFNFPHVGAGITDQDRNILTNQHMLLKFFRSVEGFLTDGPEELTTKEKNKNKRKLSELNSDSEEDENENEMEMEEEEEEESPYIIEEKEGNENQFISFRNFEKQEEQKELKIPNKKGSILITLLNCLPYKLWSLTKLATKPPFFTPGLGGESKKFKQPRYKLKRSFKFDLNLYKNYEHRRTIGFKKGLSKSKNEEILRKNGDARMYEFVLKNNDNSKDQED